MNGSGEPFAFREAKKVASLKGLSRRGWVGVETDTVSRLKARLVCAETTAEWGAAVEEKLVVDRFGVDGAVLSAKVGMRVFR